MKQTDREGGQASVSSTSIVGCREMMRDSQSEGWMKKETGNEERDKARGNREEECPRERTGLRVRSVNSRKW